MHTEQLAEGDFRKHNPRFVGEAEIFNSQLVAELGRFAAARGLTNAQVALAWLLGKHRHVVLIPGDVPPFLVAVGFRVRALGASLI